MADRGAVTAPGPVLRTRARICSWRVERDVPNRLVQMPFGRDDGVEESPLPQSAAPAMPSVVRARVDRVESLKAAAQRQLSQPKQQVIVSRQQRVREDAPVALASLLLEHAEEQEAIALVDEQLRPVHGLPVDVVDLADGFDARRGHATTLPRPGARRHATRATMDVARVPAATPAAPIPPASAAASTNIVRADAPRIRNRARSETYFMGFTDRVVRPAGWLSRRRYRSVRSGPARSRRSSRGIRPTNRTG